MPDSKSITLFVLSFFLIHCSSPEPPSGPTGEQLAKVHCGTCHQSPDPGLLTKDTWQNQVLPRMAVMMGIWPEDSLGFTFFEKEYQEEIFQNPMILRQEPTTSLVNWEKIKQYYLDRAPKEINLHTPIPSSGFELFTPHFPPYFFSPPSTINVQIEEEEIFMSDIHTGQLLAFDHQLNLVQKIEAPGGTPDIKMINSGTIITSIGSFSPTEAPSGKVWYLSNDAPNHPITLIDSLQRPVHTSVADLDKDGRFDLVTCSFGKWSGNLSWWKNDGQGNFVPTILRNMPGAISTRIIDLNKDGHLDILALFSQGAEGIYIYYGKGDGTFREESLLQFPPSYGSSYFDVFDFNQDSFPDLIYTCGDQADFNPVAKPYQGIRIFENDGNNHFDEVFFYPMQGAYKVIPEDFDLDGDIDLAAIAFFPDFTLDQEVSFLYLQNNGYLDFKAFTIPQSSQGRWICMDSGDVDMDGDIDLVLGALTFEIPGDHMGRVDQWVKDGIPFLFLENNSKK